MNRRRFLKLGTIGAAAAVAVAALPKLIIKLPPILNPEVPPTAYSTYVVGVNAMPALTVADIRECVRQLKSHEIKPIDGKFVYPIHPYWKYQWNVEAL